ncbi:hypothetical protein DITRI_Ditri02bG0153900 [Diplodiscus trichospermus]
MKSLKIYNHGARKCRGRNLPYGSRRRKCRFIWENIANKEDEDSIKEGLNVNQACNGIDSNTCLDMDPCNRALGLLLLSGSPIENGFDKNKKKKKIGEIYNKTPNFESFARGRRKAKHDLVEAVSEEQDSIANFSSFSISDDDREHKNSVIRKETEATWEVCSVLGIVFHRERDQMIEVFRRLEKDDKREGVG